MRVIAALLLVATLCLAACTRAGGSAAFAQTERVGTRSATLSIVPYPPATMRKADLRLTLRDAAGRPLSGAGVRFDLGMPDCPEMPVNQPEAAEVEPGLYAAPALFTMAGDWQARVEVTGVGEEQVFTFHLSVK